MKSIRYILGAAIATMAFASCTLDAVNYTEKSTENYPTTSGDAQQALAGVYQNLNKVNEAPQYSFLYAAQLASDDCLGGGGTNDPLMQSLDMLTNAGTDMTWGFYKTRYEGINRANALIDALENIQVANAENKAQWLGEAKFLRAFYYYELASMYGRIRMITSSTPSSDVPQATAAEEWGQILMDLRDAATTMPAVRKTDGHVDKYTAEAMLGRAWLFYTGMYGNGDDIASLVSTTYNPLQEVALPDGSTLTKADVINAIDDCVTNSGYSLVDDFRTLWAYTNRYTVEDYDYTKGKDLKWVENDNQINPESMFAIHFNKRASWSTTIGYSNGYALHFGVRGQSGTYACFPFGSGWGAGPIAPNLVSDWNAEEQAVNGKDVRRDATIADLSAYSSYVYGGDNNVQETALHSKKWSPITAKNDGSLKDKDGKIVDVPCFEELMYGNTGGESGGYGSNSQLDNIHDLVLIRFADVLLMQSELKEDVAGMNLVHKRATGVDNYYGSYKLEDLQNERRWEFAGEGIRWNDIRRWHIAASCLAKQQNVDIYYLGQPTKNYPQVGGYVARYNATAGFFKIPEQAIDLASGTLTQNPGWQDNEGRYTGWVNSNN